MDSLTYEPLNSRHDKYSQQHHPSYRQHRQDRKACRRPTRKARHPHPARIAFHRDPVRLGEPADLAAGLAGVDKVYLTYYPDLAVPGSADAIRGLIEVANDAGVGRVVLLSGRGEEEAERAEDVVRVRA